MSVAVGGDGALDRSRSELGGCASCGKVDSPLTAARLLVAKAAKADAGVALGSVPGAA